MPVKHPRPPAAPGSSSTHVPAPPHGTGLSRYGERRRSSLGWRRPPRRTFRHYRAAFPSFRLYSARARARPPGSGGGAGRPGSAHASARGSRAGRCVGRGRARVTCTPSSRRLLIGLSSRYLDPGWCGEVGSQVAQVAQRATFEYGQRASLSLKRRPAFQRCPARPQHADPLKNEPPRPEATLYLSLSPHILLTPGP